MIVQFKHFRNYQWDYNLNGLAPHPRGGVTIAYVEGEALSQVGIAICSFNDGFSKQAGRDIATKRLLTNPATIPTEQLDNILDKDTVRDLYYDINIWQIFNHFDLKYHHLIDRASGI